MPCASTTEDPWLLARDRYMRDLNEEEQRLFESASLENLLDSTIATQKSHEEQSKSRTISRRLEPFVNAVCQYGEALDVYSNTYAIAMAPLWGSIRVLLHVMYLCFYFSYSFANLLNDRSLKNSRNTSRVLLKCSLESVTIFQGAGCTKHYFQVMADCYKPYR